MKTSVLILCLLFCSSLHAQTLRSHDYALIGAATFDMESTFRGLRSCTGCSETNPILKPFAAGRLPGYAMIGSLTVGEIFVTHRLSQSHPRLSTVVKLAAIALHVTAGINNIKIQRGLQR